jgi:hypothetical protein
MILSPVSHTSASDADFEGVKDIVELMLTRVVYLLLPHQLHRDICTHVGRSWVDLPNTFLSLPLLRDDNASFIYLSSP